ncbi:hypothetical protein F3087_41575 [Nocardia colli]|uniref:Secreted protein n=1 Tax=Nocardia colli TaxID=2545717 RepID=A0A5N0DWM8_9NOCA|nr:hypothetical protein [Nocardia colli]KAA8880364.1 hypothetical protein F3087_41575 [Nocardia colli]
MMNTFLTRVSMASIVLMVAGSLCGVGQAGADVHDRQARPTVQLRNGPSDKSSNRIRIFTPQPGDRPAYSEDGVDWYPAQCRDRWYGEHKSGWIDWCYQWGEAKYPGQTAHYFVVKHYATCGNSGTDWAVSECGLSIGNVRPTAKWQDWSPRGDVVASSCPMSVSLSVSVGAFTAGGSFNACDELKMEKANPDVNYSLTWHAGFASFIQKGDQREVAYMVSFSLDAAGGGLDLNQSMEEILNS